MKIAKSLYIHIPFCRAKCPYCDFYSTPYQKDIADCYIKTLCKKLEKINNKFLTIYIGGGTPSVLDKELLGRLLKSLKKVIGKDCEFTIEANPESLDEDKIKIFRDYGINRISIGVQSLRDEKLNKLRRVHSAAQARKAVALAKKSGFKNISIDLIFGVWQESLESWQSELKEAVKLGATHISVYSLTYEKNTQFFKELKKRKVFSFER